MFLVYGAASGGRWTAKTTLAKLRTDISSSYMEQLSTLNGKIQVSVKL